MNDDDLLTKERVPPGFRPHVRRSPVTDAWDPLFSRETDGVVYIGLRVAERHCNSRAFLHGGVIAAVADNAMGLSFAMTLRARNHATTAAVVTLSLTFDFIATAKVGQWLEVRPRVLRAGRSIGFMDALIAGDGEVVARASGTFKVANPAPP